MIKITINLFGVLPLQMIADESTVIDTVAMNDRAVFPSSLLSVARS